MDLKKNKQNFELLTKVLVKNIRNGTIVSKNSELLNNLSVNEILKIDQNYKNNITIQSVLTKITIEDNTYFSIKISDIIDLNITRFDSISIDGIEFDFDNNSKNLEIMVISNNNYLIIKSNFIGTDTTKLDLNDYIGSECLLQMYKINLIPTIEDDSNDTDNSNNGDAVEPTGDNDDDGDGDGQPYIIEPNSGDNNE